MSGSGETSPSCGNSSGRLAQSERLSSLGEVVAGRRARAEQPAVGRRGVCGPVASRRPAGPGADSRSPAHRRVRSALPEDRVQAALVRPPKHPLRKRSTSSLNECVEKVLDLKSYHLRSSQHRRRVLELDPHLPHTSVRLSIRSTR